MKNMYETERLLLKIANEPFAKALAQYYIRNKDFLKNFDPIRTKEFYTEGFQFNQLKKEVKQSELGTNHRFYIFHKEDNKKIIGVISIANIIRGAFQSCHLGYKLDKDYLRKGYMSEAVRAITKVAFEELDLHRVEANVMPKNKASLGALKKCGYEEEGLAKKYLKINGVWEDHIHMVKLNE